MVLMTANLPASVASEQLKCLAEDDSPAVLCSAATELPTASRLAVSTTRAVRFFDKNCEFIENLLLRMDPSESNARGQPNSKGSGPRGPNNFASDSTSGGNLLIHDMLD